MTKRSFGSGCASAQDDTDMSVILSGAKRNRRIFCFLQNCITSLHRAGDALGKLLLQHEEYDDRGQ